MNEIRGYSMVEIEEFVGEGSDEYIERFRTLKKFNWVAAMLSYLWFGYRKIYIEGIIVFILELIVETIGGLIVLWIFRNENETSNIIRCYAVFCRIVRILLMGIVADKLYWRNIKKRIDYAHLSQEIRDKKIGLTTFHKTCKGTSGWSIIIMIVLLKISFELVIKIATIFIH